MTRTLSDKTLELLETMPPFMRQDPTIQGGQFAYAEEIDRIDAAIAALVAGFFATTADDPYLGIWERLLDLPVEPDGFTVEARRAYVLTVLRRIPRSQSGDVWHARLTDLAGSNWKDIDHHPEGLRGTKRERFNDTVIDPDWIFDAGSTGYSIQDGELRGQAATSQAYWTQAPLDSQFAQVQFTRGTADTAIVGVVLKRLDVNNLLRVDYNAGNIRVRKLDGGVLSTLDTTAIATSADTDYWLRAVLESNIVTYELWDKDPNLQQGSPLATDTYTLAGANATKYGGGVDGAQGFYASALATGWALKDWMGGEADWGAVALHHKRIILPFEPTSAQALRIEKAAQELVPAHIDLEVTYDTGFILGVSELGVQTL